MARSAAGAGPLAGLRVLDFTRVVAGPYCTMLLGDFGADVLKIEEPSGGDELRALGPPFLGGESVFYLSLNRNKRSVAVDLKRPAGREAVRELARDADIVVENFRPGVMDRLGLGYAGLRRLNPRLVYCAVSAFHAESRYRERPGYDLLISGMSGLQSMTGEPGRTPLRPGVNLVDLTAGTNATIGILMALLARQRTGRGQRVAVSLMDGAFAVLGQLAAIYLNAGTVPQRRAPEDLHPQIVPYGTFLAGDGKYLNVCVVNNKFWRAFCGAMERPQWAEDSRFETNAQRIANRQALVPLLVERFREQSRDRWIARLQTADIPAGPVNSIDEAIADGYLGEVGMLVRMDHKKCGAITVPGIPIRLSSTPGHVRRPPPLLGEHDAALATPARRKVRETGRVKVRTNAKSSAASRHKTTRSRR